jgi:hypothetical protein
MATRRTESNFSNNTVEALKKRAAFICSNPDCKKLTVSPDLNSDTSVIYIGRAAHICAASPGGPRYDANMTDQERASITNAIFLCANCADMIDDNNGDSFTKELLTQWKNDHENWTIANLNKPFNSQPTVQVTSFFQQGGITAHSVTIGNVPRDIKFEDEFLKEIANVNPGTITIRAHFSDTESQFLAHKFDEVFKKAGWSIKGPIYEIPNTPIHNVALGIPKSHRQSQTAVIIYNWLVKCGFLKTAEEVPDEKGFIIFVGGNRPDQIK